LGLVASTLYTSLFWAPNEKGDALTTLTITQSNALKAGDTESVQEIDKLIQETYEISASIPVFGFLKAELAKFETAAKASETYMKEAEKIMEEQAKMQEQGGTDEDLKYQKIEEENKKEKLRIAQIMQEVYRLRREKKYDEADALELTAYK